VGRSFMDTRAESFNEIAGSQRGMCTGSRACGPMRFTRRWMAKQRKLALLDINPPGEHAKETVELRLSRRTFEGIPMTELAKDQQGTGAQVLADLLAPFRKVDADEAMKLIEAGGFDKLHMAFFQHDGHRQRRRVGRVEDRKPEHGLVFPGRAARAHVGACSRTREGISALALEVV